MSWVTCEAKSVGQPLTPHYSRVYDHAVKPVAHCGSCSGIFSINKDGTLHKHTRHIVDPHIQSRAWNDARR